MSARCFVDTNILVYAHDASKGWRHRRARALVEELWQSRAGAISTQVLQELCVNLQKRTARPLSFDATRALIADYRAWHVVVNDGNSIVEALDIEARYRLSFWDALIVQAAQAAGADILYSENLSDGQRYGDLRVVNPVAG
jgi:predicted nucleic acid-binding protein